MKFLATIVLIFSVAVTTAQTDSSFLLLRTYSGDIVTAALDNLDNLYLVSSTGQVKKLNGQGDSVAVFSGIRNYGMLQSIDVTNPLRPLLFYKDFSTIVVLDRLLANRSRIDLRRHGILEPAAVGLAYDNTIWVYDQYDNKLKKIDESGNKLLETPDFRQLFNFRFSPQQIINDNGLVYLADTASGVLVFDNYGTFKRKIVWPSFRYLSVWNGKLVRLDGNALLVYDPATFREQRQALPSSFRPYRHSFTHRNQLITFSSDTLQVYRWGR